MEALLISACLMGFDCKYSGGNNALPSEELEALRRHYQLIPVCPELAGGLPVPRVPSERRGERVITRDGRDVTKEYQKGAAVAAALAARFGAKCALLKSNSPSCGATHVYDGSFSGRLIPGRGVTAEYLMNINLIIYENASSLLG